MSRLNILKQYPELLELAALSESDRYKELRNIFKRDIEDNNNFSFRQQRIYPTKVEGKADMDRLFTHLTCEAPENITVFNEEVRDSKKRKVTKTYIYDQVEEYVIVLEQQRSNAFYLLTAYHLNKSYGKKIIEKKMQKALSTPL